VLLRRIRHHVVNENWFAVFVDFVIVVVGVYVGIEVSNWNEARREEQLAVEYGELRLIRDAELRTRLAALSSDEEIVNSLRFWITNLSVASRLIDDNTALNDELLELVDASLGLATETRQ